MSSSETPAAAELHPATATPTPAEAAPPAPAASPAPAQPKPASRTGSPTAGTPRAASPAANLTAESAAPTQSARPISPNSRNHATLVEAFPNIDAAVVRAVLVASRGDLEPAFNALLSMSDPSAVETPPPPPPRPRVSSRSDFTTSTPQSQLEADAMYARQLQEHFGAPMPRQQTAAGSARRQPPHQVPPQRRHPNDDSDDEYYNDKDEDKDRPSFFDEDLPVIKENIKKGFIETQTKVTGWFNEFKKRIDGESPETSPPASARTSAQYSRAGSRGQQRGGYDTTTRPSYDADPKVLSDDFTHLKMAPGSESAPRRPKANPNLFQPKASAGRKVSFEERPTTIDNDEDLYRPAASSARQPSPVGRNKWEPLKSVDPEPQHKDDPFSLEDSDDDEKDGLIKEGETARPGITGAQESGVTKKNP